MKPIKIYPWNYPAIQAELDRVNGSAKAFTINSPADLQFVADEAEKRLALLPKADRAGAQADYTPAGPACRAYKYGAVSTKIMIERRSVAWYLIAVTRVTAHARDPARVSVADPSATPDPIDEIESLIGRAMRVEFALPEDEARPVPPTPAPEPRPGPTGTPLFFAQLIKSATIKK